MIVLSAPFSEFPNGVTTASCAMRALAPSDSISVDSTPQATGLAETIGSGLQAHHATLRALAGPTVSLLYRAAAGGVRAVLDGHVVRRAMRRDARAILHHHSYAYLAEPSRLHRIQIQHSRLEHVALSDHMASLLVERYNIDPHLISCINNAYSVPPPDAIVDRTKSTPAIGHMSSLTASKGVDHVLKLARDTDSGTKVIIAGPLSDRLVDISRELVADGRVQLLGPLRTSNEKQEFFRSIDLFVFPSQYRFEAQPIVLYEALSHGVAVLASDWAGIPDQLAPFSRSANLKLDQIDGQAVDSMVNGSRLGDRAKLAAEFALVHQDSVKAARNLLCGGRS